MQAAPELLFVSIAAYRDPQLVPTIRDCLQKAAQPERLRFGVCWQHGQETLPDDLWNDSRFRILDIDWRQSKGACWARAEVMKLWAGEDWFLQVDSHCRFQQGWDDLLISTASTLSQPRVVLSTYATPFIPGEHEILQEAPMQMAFQGFTPDGIPYMKPLALREVDNQRRPRRARFLSAGFLFAPGTFVQDVPYDPDLYFVGEEIAMTVRAYTSGYDLYHPHETVIWHDYLRADATKHWDDHVEEKEAAIPWGDHDLRSKSRIRKLLSGETLNGYNLGTQRSLAVYEAYAGISFRARRAQDYTTRAAEPPNPPLPPDWADRVYPWMVRIAFASSALPEDARTSALLWYIGVHDELGNEIYRRDLTQLEIQALPKDQPETILLCELQSGSIPATWTVWPLDATHRWLPKISGTFQEGEYTILADENLPTSSENGEQNSPADR